MSDKLIVIVLVIAFFTFKDFILISRNKKNNLINSAKDYENEDDIETNQSDRILKLKQWHQQRLQELDDNNKSYLKFSLNDKENNLKPFLSDEYSLKYLLTDEDNLKSSLSDENGLKSSLITSNLEQQMIETYSNNISSQKIIATAIYKELLTQIKKLGFEVEELDSYTVLEIVKALDIIGATPTFLRVKDAEYFFILAIDGSACFSFINIFSVSEKYDDSMIKFMTAILNRNINKYPIPVHYVFDNTYEETLIYSFTPFAQYTEDNFQDILKLFSTKFKIDLDTVFNVNLPLPKFINEILKNQKKRV